MDETLHLSSGASARVRNIIVVQRASSGTTLSVMVQRGSSWGDATPFVAEELAQAHNEFAQAQNARRIAIAICDTPACVETTALPSEIYYFTRDEAQRWRLSETVQP
jgi:hypothetical protein